jgi:hypothetical protein
MKARKVLERAVKVSGAIVRTVIGIGASVVLFFAFKKKNKKGDKV